MFLLSVFFVELLILIAVSVQLYYFYKQADCQYSRIAIGLNPKLYHKNYKGIDFVFCLLPFLYDYDLSSYTYSKRAKITGFGSHAIPFIFIAIIHSIIVLFLCGFDFWYISYKVLITTQISDREATLFSYQLGRLLVQPTAFLIVSIVSSALVYLWFIIIIRGLCDRILNVVKQRFNISINNTFKYLIPTFILIYLWLNSSAYKLLLIFSYDSTISGLIDWLIAHLILMIFIAFIIEILTRIGNTKTEI